MRLIHVRLDMNSLAGHVPTNLNSLTGVAKLHLASNKLTGPLLDLTGMNALSFVDMSNNSFDASDIPRWFASLPSLTALYLEYLKIGGQLPQGLFSASPMQTLRLRNNLFNGTLNIGLDYGDQLQLIDLQDNQISEIILGGGYNIQIILVGNPVCNNGGISLSYCTTLQNSAPPYSTPKNCVTLPPTCSSDQSLSPNCNCAFPYMGTLNFRSPSFSNLGNTTYYHNLEQALQKSFTTDQLPVDSVSLSNPFVDSDSNLEISLQVFPSGKIRFSESDVAGLGFILSNQTFKPPSIFGPYYFIGQQYSHFTVPAPAPTPNHLPVIVGATIGDVALLVILIILGVFVIKRWKQTKKYEDVRSQSYVSWDPRKNSGRTLQLKGARSFSLEELQKCTDNFSVANEIGSGGYRKVYRGTLSNGQLIAVKGVEEDSMQGELEFKTEIELLSRVHHKNLVSLVGFCFDQGEQMLVYNYVPNGTLKESLSGDDARGHITAQVKGTMGYLDPEYYMTQQLTAKSDVYSFGVLLLEIITAKKPLERGQYVVREVNAMMDKSKDLYSLHELLDPALGSGTAIGGFERYVDLAMRCLDESGVDRPKMSEVVNELEKIMLMAGMNLNADSASTWMSYYDVEMSKSPMHSPYGNEVSFNYSGGAPSPKLEPK